MQPVGLFVVMVTTGGLVLGACQEMNAQDIGCADLLARIRATLQIAKLPAADAARVEALVRQGQALLDGGDSTGCRAPLREAEKILGM